MADYRINRDRYPLDSNCAGQIELTCQGCRDTFDVGVERARSATFTPYCWACWSEHLVLLGHITTLGDAA